MLRQNISKTSQISLPSRYFLILALVILGAWLLSSCGGGSPYTTTNTSNGMGTVLMTMTDAEGDFAAYTVDVASITLKRANGTVVETLANQGRLDFTHYVEMTELFNIAQVPAGRYVASEITLNYNTADIQVEVGGVATPAEFIDETGNALSVYTITLQLADDYPLVVTPGRPSLLSVDFDLDASHTVDTTVFPPRVTVAPFLVADVEPVAEKELRVSGSLVEIDLEAMSYSIRLRPWHHRHGDFGLVTVNVGEDTSFEIDGETLIGQDGLAGLDIAGPDTPTVAVGTLDVVRRSFSATHVLVGESVPGHGFDGVVGNLGARNGDILTVRRATVIPESGSVIFNDEVQVTVGPETVVKKRGQASTQVNIGDLSVGQRVHIAGQITSDLALPGLIMDATTGRVRMIITRLDGTVNSTLPGLLSMNLQRIDRRPVRIFDFSGTGISLNVDTDPTDYEVATDTLSLVTTLTPGSVVRASGFVRPFGAAPDDFEAHSIVSLAAGRAKLGISWGVGGTTAPFLSMGTDDGLVPDLDNPDLGERHHVKLGGVVLDLLDFSAAPVIIPTTKNQRLFAIKRGNRTRGFRNFEKFTETLANLLDGATVVKSMHAKGAYKQAENILTASIVSIHLQVP